MKKIFGFGSKKGESSLVTSISPRRDSVGVGQGDSKSVNAQPGYHIRDKDLGKIHKAASVGNVARVQQILLLGKNGLNDRDKRNRTALHLACASGYPEVVTLLVERKCQLNLCDSKHRTALMKAVQCQEAECATILLEHGADPNLTDINGNTALHYAACGHNVSIAAKLLSHNANIGARNKDNLTPLLLAKSENKEQMVEFLVKQEANIHAVDNIKSHRQTISDCTEKSTKNTYQNNNPVDESSDEDSLSRLSNKPGIDDSWPTSDDEHFDFTIKDAPKPNLAKLMTAFQQSRKNIQEKSSILRPENRTLFEDCDFDSEDEDVVETLPKPSFKVQGFSHSAFPSPDPTLKCSLNFSAVSGATDEGATWAAVEKRENVDIESATREQRNNDNFSNLSYVDRVDKNNRSDMMSALGLGEEEDEESSWDSESVSERLPQKYAGHLSVVTDKKEESTFSQQIEDVLYVPSWMSGSRSVNMDKIEDTRNVGIPVAYMESPEKYSLLKPSVEMKDSAPGKATRLKNMQTSKSAELDIKMTLEEEQERLDESESNQSQVDGKETKLKSSELEVSENLCDPAAANGTDALIQQGKDGKMHTQQFPFKENEDSDSDPAVYMMNIKKHESKNYTSADSVMTPALQKAPSLTGVLQVSDDTSRSETGQEEGRPVNKTSDEKSKVLMQINPMDDPEDLSQSSEGAFKYKSSRLLIEQLGMNYKDSVSLLKIQDAILSYERLVELKKNQCELLTDKIKKMESKVSALQKELSETKEMKSQLEYQKVEWKGEVCSLRFTLKQEEEKRRNADMLCEKITEQLRRLEKQYSKEMEMKQQLEFSLRALDTELRTVRSNLNQVVEERNDAQRQLSQEQNARMLQDEILTNQLCKQKELEMAQKKMMQNSEVSSSDRKEEDLLHKNHMLQDEIARLILERDLLKNQNQEKEKKYSDDIEIIKEKNDDLQKTLKQNEESLTKTVLQYSGQIDVLTAENTILKSKLESEKQNNERLETEAESYRSRLAAAIHDHDKSQTSKRDLELAFQRERDKCLRLQDKMNFDLSNLKDNNETLSQELSKAENKFNSLEIELHHTKDALREKTLVLESVQRELSQTQCQMKEIEYMYQNEEGKVNKYIAKQESIEERLSQLQSENMLLRQQLDDAHNKADSKEKAVMNIQDQFHDIVKKIQVESEKQSLMLEERNKELLDECNHLKERVYQYENEKAEREAVVRQLQQELADTLKKQSMSEASLEVTSRYRINLEDEIQDLKKKLHQIRCRLEEAQDGHTEAIRCAKKTQEHLEKVEIENAELKVTVKKQTEKIEQFQKNLLGTCLSEDEKEQLKKLTELKQSLEYRLDQEMKRNGELEKEILGFKRLLKMTQKKITEYENGELSFHGDLKTNQIEMDIQVAMLKHKIEDLTAKLATSSSECLHLDAKNQALQQELTAMEPVQKKCEKLKKSKKLLKQEVVNLRSHLEINMIERSHMEQYKREIDERARQEVVEKLQEVNLFLQTQAASQEYLEQLRENNNASVRSQLELRIKDLESEISKMKTCQEDSRTELEKYKQLYLEELKVSKSLSNELNKTNEKLTEISAKLLMEKQKNRSSLSVLTTHIFQEPACVGDIHNSSVLNRSLVPRENLVIPTLRPRPSNNSIETYLSKVQQEFEKTITRELAEAAAECESGSCSSSPVRSADSSQNQDLLMKASQEYVQILKKNYMI